jgi:predicted dehydrogenase
MNRLRIGMLGMSEGNGHPYSWSAICNGYDPRLMERCPFPVIPQYLAKQRFPDDMIQEAEVTHIWTQDRALSEPIAAACFIGTIAENPEDMLGSVDAVLLARDDYENHLELSRPFLEAGLPVYIDKPLAVTRRSAERIYSLEKYAGQIFTCTAFRFSKEFTLTDADREQIGRLVYVDGCVMKGWDKYGIHMVEPALQIIGPQGELQSSSVSGNGQSRTVTVQWSSGLRATFTSTGTTQAPVTLRLFGTKGSKQLVLSDTFYAFKTALQTFVDCVRGHRQPPSRSSVMEIVNLLERGLFPLETASTSLVRAREAEHET